jgi:protein-S-isoprenylcysteine O-methyltransferase Ste14
MRHVVDDLADWVTVVCWGIVGLVWVVGAVQTRMRGPTIERRESTGFPSLIGFAVSAFAIATPASLWDTFVVDSSWVHLAGVLLLLVATPAAVWARISLGRLWQVAAVTKEGHTLRTTGPYHFTRHPIYTALLTMLLGTALSQGIGRWAAILVAVTIVILVKIRTEERLLLREFPDEYRRYQEHVPRLIPFAHR